MLSTLQFSLPPHPQQRGLLIPGLGTNPWALCFQLWWIICWWFIDWLLGLCSSLYGVFFILQGKRELASCGSESYPCVYSCLSLLCGVHALKANEAHEHSISPYLVLYSSGDWLKVSTSWQSEERTMSVCCWWQGSASCPGGPLCFSFFALLRSWSFLLKRFFWKGRNVLGNLCRSALSFWEVFPWTLLPLLKHFFLL